jgi:uncharacterized integral membrane protein
MQKVQFNFIVGLVFAIIITIFALTNANPVAINLFFYKFEASQALVIFISAALGAVIVTSLGLVSQLKLKGEIKALRKANEELSAKIQNLTVESKSIGLSKNETEASHIDSDIETKNNDN